MNQQRRLANQFSPTSTLVSLLVLSTLLSSCLSVRFYMHDHERRCFKFESEYDSLIQAHANVENGKGSAELIVEVYDSSRRVVYQTHMHEESKQSSVSFRTPKYDPNHMHHDAEEEEEEAYDYDPRELEGWFEACLTLALDRSTHDPNIKRAITFWVKAQDYSLDHREEDGAKATDQQVVSVSSSLADIQSTLQKMVAEIVHLQHRERRLVDHNTNTAKRLSALSVFSLILLLATGGAQFLHFKSYFKSKKLI